MRAYKYFDGDTFEHKSRTFRVEHPYDQDRDAPWKECDGHGVVSEWTTRDKAPGERVLCADRSPKRFYDVQETMKIARRDAWGLGADDIAKLAATFGRAPTKGEIIAAAVESDFKFLYGWCNDQWSYVGVVVRLVDDNRDESESLWGVESNAYDCLAEVAHELADEICARLDDEMAAEITASRPDMYQDHTPA